QLPEQNVGIGFIEGVEEYEVEEDPVQQRRSRTMFIVVGAVLIVAVIVAIIFLNTGDQRIRSTVDGADDTVTTEPLEMDEGSVTGHYSNQEDVAYLTFEDVPEIDDDQIYQVWLFEEPGGSVVSVDTYTQEQLENDEV